MPKLRMAQTLLFAMLLSVGSAQASPWYDELLYEYRHNGDLEWVRFPGDAMEVRLNHPFWVSVVAFNSLFQMEGELTGHLTSRNFAVYLSPWKTYNSENREFRLRTRLLVHRYLPEKSNLRLTVQVQEYAEDAWEDIRVPPSSTHETLYGNLAVGLTYARYLGAPEVVPEVLKQALEQTRRSSGSPSFLPPKQQVEIPADFAALSEEPQPATLRHERKALEDPLAQGVLTQPEFDYLVSALERLGSL